MHEEAKKERTGICLKFIYYVIQFSNERAKCSSKIEFCGVLPKLSYKIQGGLNEKEIDKSI